MSRSLVRFGRQSALRDEHRDVVAEVARREPRALDERIGDPAEALPAHHLEDPMVGYVGEEAVGPDDEPSVELAARHARGLRSSAAEPRPIAAAREPLDVVPADDPRFAVTDRDAEEHAGGEYDHDGGRLADRAKVRIDVGEEAVPCSRGEKIERRVEHGVANALEDEVGRAAAVTDASGSVRDREHRMFAAREDVGAILRVLGSGNGARDVERHAVNLLADQCRANRRLEVVAGACRAGRGDAKSGSGAFRTGSARPFCPETSFRRPMANPQRSAARATVPLLEWVWRSYLRASLAPLLLVELLIVTVYLAANYSATRQHQHAVRALAEAELERIVTREANVVQEQLAAISRSTDMFRRQAELAIRTPFDPGPEEVSRYAYAEDGGAYHSTRDNGGASVYYSGIVPVGPEERLKAAQLTQLDPLMRDLKKTQPLLVQVYFNTHDSLNRLYPYFDAVGQLPSKMNIPSYNFYYAADAAHDPSRAVVWTGVYVDPVGNGWMTSAVAPVYRGDFLEGVVGLDVTVGTITQSVLALPLPWAGYGVLLGEDGTLLAIPRAGEKDFGLSELTTYSYDQAVLQDTFKPESFNLFMRPGLASLGEKLRSRSGIAPVELGGSKLAAWSVIPETGWKLLVIVPEENIYAHAREVGQQMLSIGVWMIAGLVVFYAVFLVILYRRARGMARSISAPLHRMDELVERIASGEYEQEAPLFPVAELQTTVNGVVEMGTKLGHALLAANESTRVKGEFLATVSHELRTPLNTIVNIPSWLIGQFSTERGAKCLACEALFELEPLEQIPASGCPECGAKGTLEETPVTRFTGDAAEAAKYLDSVHRSGKHLLEVVDQVLEMSKAESGTMSLRVEVLDVSAVLTRVMSTVAPIAERNGIRIEVSHAPDLTVEADPVKLAQVLINLTSNAIKFSPSGSLVEVSVTEERDAIRFVVCDQGIGIAREHHEIVFESFRQVEGGHTRRFGGTGLGLAIARKLVELHDGEIWLESAPGRGTTFFVRLPRRRAACSESSGAFVVAPVAAADPRGLQGGIDYGGARP